MVDNLTWYNTIIRLIKFCYNKSNKRNCNELFWNLFQDPYFSLTTNKQKFKFITFIFCYSRRRSGNPILSLQNCDVHPCLGLTAKRCRMIKTEFEIMDAHNAQIKRSTVTFLLCNKARCEQKQTFLLNLTVLNTHLIGLDDGITAFWMVGLNKVVCDCVLWRSGSHWYAGNWKSCNVCRIFSVMVIFEIREPARN